MAVNVWKNGCFSIPFVGLSHDHPTVTTVAVGFTLEIGVRLVRNAISQHCLGGFCEWSQVQGRSPVFVGKVKVTQPLYLQMLLAPDRGILVWGSPDYLYSLYLLLLDSQLWIDVDSARACLYKSDSISWYYRFAVIWYTCILFKDRTSRKDMAFLLHVDSSRPWQLIALSVWWNAMPGSFASSSERSKLYEWTRTLHDRVATIVTYNQVVVSNI